ncbi:MAG: hypothetical protein JWM91_1972 [Rhodospirillales bacterium]|nr:hypothetical protein [Rhodospirillales bacterium]
MQTVLTIEMATRFAGLALGHVTREFPNKLDHVIGGPADVRGPKALHPIFYGSFDWHSCVHGYWLLASLYRRFPDLPERSRIRAIFDVHLVPDKVAGELSYLARPGSQTFERPYGWAWLLMLAAELMRHESQEGQLWTAALAPLAAAFAERIKRFLPDQPYPIRTGTHANSAFALALASEFANIARDEDLTRAIADRTQVWYARDAGCQAWEPDGDAFLSPVLIEAECMRRVLPHADFRTWFGHFLPNIMQQEPPALFAPALVGDRSDGKIAHLDGLNLSRAWCWTSIAAVLDEPGRQVATAAAQLHLVASLPHIAGDYAGEHWLASFALLAVSA